jgi:hypothetical protein
MALEPSECVAQRDCALEPVERCLTGVDEHLAELARRSSAQTPHPELEIDWHAVSETARDAFMWEVHIIGSYCEVQSALVANSGRVREIDTHRVFVFEPPPASGK